MNEPQASSESTILKPRTWFEGLDGLRAFAALLIVVDHSAEFSGLTFRDNWMGPYFARLDIGVCIFFVLSGFLLFRPFVHAQFTGKTVSSSGPFWFRRIVRIYPAYWVALTVALIFDLCEPVRDTTGHFLSFGLVHIYSRDISRIFSGITQSWSLVTELGFYFILPFLAMIGRRLGKGRSLHQQATRLLLWCCALAVGSLVFRIVMFKVSNWEFATWGGASVPWTPSYMDTFAAGMLLAVFSAWIDFHPQLKEKALQLTRRPWIWWTTALLLFWFMCTQLDLARGTSRVSFEMEVVRQSLYGLIGIRLVVPIIFGVPRSGFVLRFLSWRPMAYLGKISYGIYLWHMAFLYLAINIWGWQRWTLEQPAIGNFWGWLSVSVIGSIAAASLSHHLIESPLTQSSKNFLLRFSRK